MISDEKRREVAERLRVYSHDFDFSDSDPFWYVSKAVFGDVDAHTCCSVFDRLADLIDRPTCHNASGHQDMCAQKPRTRKRAIYLVTDFGGDWEDAWERPVIAFTDKARAEECAAKRETRQYDEYGPIWDYEGSEVKEITLVDFGDRQEEK